jgi:hypothetical protein
MDGRRAFSLSFRLIFALQTFEFRLRRAEKYTENVSNRLGVARGDVRGRRWKH